MINKIVNWLYKKFTKAIEISYKITQYIIDILFRIANKLLWLIYKKTSQIFDNNITLPKNKLDYRYHNLAKKYENYFIEFNSKQNEYNAIITNLTNERDELLRFKNSYIGSYIIKRLDDIEVDLIDEMSKLTLRKWKYLLCGGNNIEYVRANFNAVHEELLHSIEKYESGCKKYINIPGFVSYIEDQIWNDETTTMLLSGCIYLPNNIQSKIKSGVGFDFGGYNGIGALLFSEICKHVYVFEPSTYFDIMTNNIKLTEVKNITCVNLGVSNSIKDSELVQPSIFNKGSIVLDNIKEMLKMGSKDNKSPEALFDCDISITKIKLTTIDDFVDKNINKNDRVSLMKFDIEGSEYDAIQGGLETIINHKPVLLISIYHTGKDLFEIKDVIKNLNLGYKFMLRYFVPGNEMSMAEYILICYVD